jgi:hypothetical protein
LAKQFLFAANLNLHAAFFDSERLAALRRANHDNDAPSQEVRDRFEDLASVRELELRRELEPLLAVIRAKNRLWFDYWRPQNWAFLAGDRTAQPSSRDHLDPSKRWFPPEREAFLPLIEAKEKEIDALAQKLAKP